MKVVRPSKNFVFAEVVEDKENKTTSGLLLSTKIEKNEFAVVIETGPSSDIIFTPGFSIFYKPFSATYIDLNDKKYILISVFDVLGTVIEEKK